MPSRWYLYKDGQQSGPYSFKQLTAEVQSNRVVASDLVRSEGMENWTRAEQVNGLIPAAPPSDSQLSQQPSVEDNPPDSSAQAAAGAGPPPLPS